MKKRSLKTSETGKLKAKAAFERSGWTQQDLASEVGLETRQSIWKFLTGRPIDRAIFMEICYKLDLDWQDIADLPSDVTPEPPKTNANPGLDPPIEEDITALVTAVRSRMREPIRAQCGTLRLLDKSQPVALDDIYIQINILEQLNRQRWLEVSDLQFQPRQTRQSKGPVHRSISASEQQSKIPAIQAVSTYSKLLILGKPGAGKTTFLQFLALGCIQEETHLKSGFRTGALGLPIFIKIRDWRTESKQSGNRSLLHYITKIFNNFGLQSAKVETLLQGGHALVLLDGLDEIPPGDSREIAQEINQFCEIYYQNQVVITCRLGGGEYHFTGFTEVELADFDGSQIEAFAEKWFVAARGDREAGLLLSQRFLEKLHLPENQPIRELVVTPILLTLTASIFQTKEDFPNKRSKLYEAGLDILLVRWDEARGIQRDEVYRNLSLPRKIELLSQIAATTFTENNYFFEKREIEHYIGDYLATLPQSNTAPETLRSQSSTVLDAIEAQHGLLVERARGIYSFSHLTFQEYFTARQIAATPDPNALEEELQGLASHVCEPRWREVVLLTSELLRNADPLLQAMKQQIDVMLVADGKLQQFLACTSAKCRRLEGLYKPAAVRAFYFTLFRDRSLGLALALDPSLARDLAPELALDLELARALELVYSLTRNPDVKQILSLGFALDLDRSLTHEPKLREGLQELKDQLPDPGEGRDRLIAWWGDRAHGWAEQFRALLIEHRQIGHNWQFTPRQVALLDQYYQANQLLVDCLHGESHCSSVVRSHLEATLLLPVGEIETSEIASNSSSDYFIQISDGAIPFAKLIP
ncbi:NACHT domain-containing protein [Laspinema olomoucense]|uniref:NACHT domain-containing protein n=1 Tax=Laspinema olomoucense TaxID=3231600 RepID=UPI0021BACF87|nr:NACHT domain-containing NTPase [Laspinema sp. D3a]MCT7988756.1 NACHT domain-containing NTPase [Laspinema sp. D3a]